MGASVAVLEAQTNRLERLGPSSRRGDAGLRHIRLRDLIARIGIEDARELWAIVAARVWRTFAQRPNPK